ncbi:GDSL-type esterase/lipase family protein [Peptococcaceae bacterium 1198_IL3148]
MPTIVCLGDSITAGYPYAKDKSWVHLCQQKLNLDLINAGVSNDTVADMLARYDIDVAPHHPDAVIILAGTNDAWQGIAFNTTQNNYLNLLKKVMDTPAVAILGLPAPIIKEKVHDYYQLPNVEAFNLRLNEIRSWIKLHAKDNGLNLFDFYQPLCQSGTDQGNAELYYHDGGHPNIRGYQILAQNIEKPLLKLAHNLQRL